MSMRSLGKKLERLHESAQQRGLLGCPGCRERKGRIVMVIVRRLPDGQEVPETPYPSACSVCGQVPEMLIRILETVVEANGEEMVVDP